VQVVVIALHDYCHTLVYALEPSDGTNKVLKNISTNEPRSKILQETVGTNSIPSELLDLAMSLGVHHNAKTSFIMLQNEVFELD
jgi:hypothetical protein